MKIRFAEIPDEGMDVMILDHTWFPDRELNRSGPISVAVRLIRKREGGDLMPGSMTIELLMECDLCLDEYHLMLDETFRVDLEVEADGMPAAEEHQCSADEMDAVFLPEPEIDVNSLLRQQVFLLVPDKRMCTDDCKGLCPHCGGNRNDSECACASKMKTSPFSILGNFKK